MDVVPRRQTSGCSPSCWGRGGTAVLNADSPEFAAARRAVPRARCSMSSRYRPASRAAESAPCRAGADCRSGSGSPSRCSARAREIDLPLVGEFQAMNVLAALGPGDRDRRGAARRGRGAAASQRRARPHAAGRRDRRPARAIFVDYAHTPDALATVLSRAAPACRAAARGCLRRRRRPRPRQAPADGPGRDRAGRPRLCHRRQSAQRGPGGDSPCDPRRGARRRRDRRPARGDRRRNRRTATRAMCWSLPARARNRPDRRRSRCCRSTMRRWRARRVAAAGDDHDRSRRLSDSL